MNYPGGKNGAGVYHAIIGQMPPHNLYIEPFLGSGAVLRFKRPAAHSIGIDLSAAAIAGFGAAAPDGKLDLHCGDCRPWLEKNSWLGFEARREVTLLYADPPYLLSARSSQQEIYEHELATREEHEELLRLLKKFPALVMVSGYRSDLYDARLKGWRRVDFPSMTRGGPAVESLWCNFAEPTALHDYRFAGRNFRERWRMKKMMRRWLKKLAEMPALERNALSQAVQDSLASTSATDGVPAGKG